MQAYQELMFPFKDDGEAIKRAIDAFPQTHPLRPPANLIFMYVSLPDQIAWMYVPYLAVVGAPTSVDELAETFEIARGIIELPGTPDIGQS